MKVGRKSTLAMLMVVVLWTAMPALSCLPPPAQHACCRGMAESCGSPAMSHQSCCQVHSPDATIPLVRITTPESPLTLANSAHVNIQVPSIVNASSLQMAEATPPASPPGDNSILRI
jgi:hypothetical protein